MTACLPCDRHQKNPLPLWRPVHAWAGWSKLFITGTRCKNKVCKWIRVLGIAPGAGRAGMWVCSRVHKELPGQLVHTHTHTRLSDHAYLGSQPLPNEAWSDTELLGFIYEDTRFSLGKVSGKFIKGNTEYPCRYNIVFIMEKVFLWHHFCDQLTLNTILWNCVSSPNFSGNSELRLGRGCLQD